MNQVIIYKQDNGVVAIIRPTEEALALYGIEAIAQKDVPAGKPYKIIDASEIPADRTFRDAWCPCDVNKIRVDIDKAKSICHDKRRAARAKEFAPLDVEATIPTKAQEAEAKRQQVRDKYATIQANIDAAADVAALKSIVEAL